MLLTDVSGYLDVVARTQFSGCVSCAFARYRPTRFSIGVTEEKRGGAVRN